MAKSILANAKGEMKEFKHPYVGTEHLILALLKVDKVAQVAKKYQLTYQYFRKELERVVGYGTGAPRSVMNTPLLDKIISGVNKASNNQPSAFLYFRAILDNGEGVACRILDNMDIDLDGFYDEIVEILRHDTYSFLKKFNCLIDMNEEVKKDETVVTGFDKELDQLLKNLLRMKKPNTIIVGEPGVGKTALVEKLAVAINNGEVPAFLQNLKIIQLSLGSAVAGTKYRGEFEEKINNIITEIEKYDNIVLFIDEVHNMIGAGGAEGAIDASEIFKPYLARGRLRMIGATTKAEYDQYLTKDKAFARRFNLITILEATKEETISIMKANRSKLEKHYSIRISDKNIEEIYKESTHRNGRMPDIALDQLEEWCVNKYFEKEKKKEKKEVAV